MIRVIAGVVVAGVAVLVLSDRAPRWSAKRDFIGWHAANPSQTFDDYATEQVARTWQFHTYARTVRNPAALMIEDSAPGRVTVGLFEDLPDHFARGGTFLVFDDGRVQSWDFARDEWRDCE